MSRDAILLCEELPYLVSSEDHDVPGTCTLENMHIMEIFSGKVPGLFQPSDFGA